MPEKGPESLSGGERNEKLKSELSAEKKTAKASESEIKQAKVELEKSGEKAEAKLASEAEKEATEAKLAKRTEKETTEAKKAKEAEKPEKHEPRVASTPKERSRAYKRELRKVQAQLPAGSRTFSKVVHNRAVESVSDAAEKTVARSSVLIGGTVVGILLGGLIYYSAHHYGYLMPSWSLVFFLVVGGVLGVLIEFLLKATHSTK